MKLHFHPGENWMNDPNGLVQYHGWYHLFYQYNPHGLDWGDIHWGHARSKDLYAWEHMPIAMTPDAAKREQHCFSGSCCKDKNGQPHFYYTSIGYEQDHRMPFDGAQQWRAEPTDDDLTTLCQTDVSALTDDMHVSMKPFEWRDPCVVSYGDGYLMLLGGCMAHRGCVLLYTSPDMKQWTFQHILAQSDFADDVPWECPNISFVDGKTVVFYSPCSEVRYLLGTLDDTLHLQVEQQGVLDPGSRDGYYAPQVFTDEQGRSIVMSWMPECDGGEDVRRRGYSGCMAMPRVLHIRNGDLHADLLDGWQAYCDVEQPVMVKNDTAFSCEIGKHDVLQTTLQSGQTLKLRLLAAGQNDISAEETLLNVTADPQQVTAQLDRTHSSRLANASTKPLAVSASLENRAAQLTVVVDETTVEVCLNGRWMSARAYPQQDAGWLGVEIHGGDIEIQRYVMR